MNGHFSIVYSLRECSEWPSWIVSVKSDLRSVHVFNVLRIVYVPAVRFVASPGSR